MFTKSDAKKYFKKFSRNASRAYGDASKDITKRLSKVKMPKLPLK